MKREQGLVIVAVLWICALIMWLALQTSANIRLQNEEEIQDYRRAKALYYAIGGAYEALAHMGQTGDVDADTQLLWEPDGKTRRVKFKRGQALVVIEPETTRVNVNKASPTQLAEVLEEAGLDLDTAEMMADRIGDFIDQDDLPRLQGAEAEEYENQEIPYPPFDGPLLSLDQLLLVPGISSDLFYGFGRKPSQEGENDKQDKRDAAFPARDSLFELLTVYGNNAQLQAPEGEQAPDGEPPASEKVWVPGTIYRILSAGRVGKEGATIVVWVVAKYNPGSPSGYEVLYQKIL